MIKILKFNPNKNSDITNGLLKDYYGARSPIPIRIVLATGGSAGKQSHLNNVNINANQSPDEGAWESASNKPDKRAWDTITHIGTQKYRHKHTHTYIP